MRKLLVNSTIKDEKQVAKTMFVNYVESVAEVWLEMCSGPSFLAKTCWHRGHTRIPELQEDSEEAFSIQTPDWGLEEQVEEEEVDDEAPFRPRMLGVDAEVKFLGMAPLAALMLFSWAESNSFCFLMLGSKVIKSIKILSKFCRPNKSMHLL